MDSAERLERMDSAIDDLCELALSHIILIEGRNDALALRELGVEADMFCVQSGGGPVKAAEYAWNLGRPAVILTDWDRRGDSLADDLRRNLNSLCVRYDDSIRDRLSHICGQFCPDVESLHLVRRMLAKHAEQLRLYHPSNVKHRKPAPSLSEVGGPHKRPVAFGMPFQPKPPGQPTNSSITSHNY